VVRKALRRWRACTAASDCRRPSASCAARRTPVWSAPASTAPRPSGASASIPSPWLQRVLRRCVTAGWVDLSAGDRPVVILTEAGRAV
jgi:hypothetical protein